MGPVLLVDCIRSVLSTSYPGTALSCLLEEHVLPRPLRGQVSLHISHSCRSFDWISLARNTLWCQCSTQRIPAIAEITLSNLCKEVATIYILYPFIKPECMFLQLCLRVNVCQTWSCIAELMSFNAKHIRIFLVVCSWCDTSLPQKLRWLCRVTLCYIWPCVQL